MLGDSQGGAWWHPSLAQSAGAILQWGTECTDCLVEKACELESLWRLALVC